MKLPSLNNVVNVVLLLVALLIGGLHLRNYFFPPTSAPARPTVVKGQPAPTLPGIDYSRASRTVVLFLHSQCQYCTQSLPFYRSLAEAHDPAGPRLVVATRESIDTLRSYLRDNQVDIEPVVSIGIGGDRRLLLTPTVFAVSSDGNIENAWLGALDQASETAVRQAVRSP